MPYGDEWFAAMRRGDVATALRINDAVLAARDPASRDDSERPYHERWVWDGRPFEGRRVLVRCYHGLGDTLQYSRFLAPLRLRAEHVLLEVQAALRPLLHGLADQVVAFDERHPLPSPDVDIEIMELSHALRLGVDDVPPPILPLSTEWNGAVGLCWQAGDWDAGRSLPLAQLISALPTAKLISLQRGAAAVEARDGFENPGDDDPDVTRTARLIAGCSRVLTVDTMVAHLAGTLGAPTLLLLRHGCDWRWRDVGDIAPGYPSVRLLRQAMPGDWSMPLQSIGRLM